MKRYLLGALGAAMIAVAGLAIAQHLRPEDLAAYAGTISVQREAYGTDPLQFGELRLPEGTGPFPVAVIIHGGCWTKGMATLSYMSPLADALARKGVASWNIEYRQLGNAGAGWPGSFLDWAAATDHLRSLAQRYPIDLTRVIAIGHSAGAPAALWIAARHRLAATSAIRGGDPLEIAAAVAIDGPVDLMAFIGPDKFVCDKSVVSDFMGGTPSEQPGRYAEANPIALLPLDVPVALIASNVLTPAESDRYRRAAAAKGDRVELLSLEGAGHFDMLAPGKPAGAVAEALILQILAFAKP
jgi:acetyl esterase/lipase